MAVVKLGVLCACALATGVCPAGPWRSYSVYRPKVETGCIYDGATGKLKYNHCASVVWYRGRWFAVWNANSIPVEGKPAQPVVLATSRDFLNWAEPVEPFLDPRYCTNPLRLGKGRQWQPNLLVYKDELWCTWSQSSGGDKGLYFSYLREPDGKWTNRRLEFGDEAVIEGVSYTRFFPTQNPVIIRSGRVLAPLNLIGPTMPLEQDVQPWRKRRKRNTVMYTDDAGKTWRLSPGSTIPGYEWACWEPTVWETDDGLVRMFARNNNWNPVAVGGHPTTKMLTKSVSRDGGVTWTPHEFVPIETICSRAHVVPLVGDRFAMVMNDWRKGTFPTDRHNGALFFNRGGGWDFVAGANVSGRDTRVAYPQVFVKDNAVHIAYTRQGAPAAIRYSRVSPLPDPRRYYLVPRSNTGPSPLPMPAGSSLAFDTWQRLGTRWAKRDPKTDLSMGMWVNLGRAGVLLDTRKSGKAGLLFHACPSDDGLVPVAFLSTKERNIYSKLHIHAGEWCYIGLSIDNAAGKVHFFLNEQTEVKTFMPPAPLAGDTAHLGFKRLKGSRCVGLVGQIRWAGMYDGHCLSAGQHRALFNALAKEFGKPVLPNARPAPSPVCELDPSRPRWADGFVLPVDESMRVSTVERDGRPCVRFSGEASAGVDLDRNRPGQGDVVEFEFAFRLETRLAAQDEVVLCTTGGGDMPLRLVVNAGKPDTVQMRLAGKLTPADSFDSRGWAKARLRISADSSAVSIDSGKPVVLPFPTADTWLYLGQGYLEGRVRSGQAFVVDLGSIRSRVGPK